MIYAPARVGVFHHMRLTHHQEVQRCREHPDLVGWQELSSNKNKKTHQKKEDWERERETGKPTSISRVGSKFSQLAYFIVCVTYARGQDSPWHLVLEEDDLVVVFLAEKLTVTRRTQQKMRSILSMHSRSVRRVIPVHETRWRADP